MYQLVVFDWDGTLMDSAQKIANCIRAAARDLGIAEPSDNKAKSIIGLSLFGGMQRLFPQLNKQQTNNLVEVYKHHFVKGDVTEQKMFAGVEQGLQTLNDSGVLLAVATGKSRTGLDRELNEVNLRHHFVATRCADETRSKPHPQMLLELLDYTAIDPKKSIMIGDTSFDMEMAANAGVHGLGVSYGVHSESALRDANAIDVVDSFLELVAWLTNNRLEKAFS